MAITSEDGIPILREEPGAFGPTVTPAEVRAMLRPMAHGGGEMALLDVREEGVFSESAHLLFANSVRLSRLELLIRELVPRTLTPIVVLDGGEEGLAERAAARLASMGYRNVAVMAGGARGWQAAGFELFTGVNRSRRGSGGRRAGTTAGEPRSCCTTAGAGLHDCWRRPYDPYAGEGARERYLRWETELLHRIEREGDVGFRVPG